MRTAFLICICCSIQALSVLGQGLHRMSGQWFYQTEASLGVIPRVQLGEGLNTGLGLGLGRFVIGEYGGVGGVIQAGGQYDWEREQAGWHTDLWLNGLALVLPYGIGVGVNQYFGPEGSTLNPSVQLGIGGIKGMLTYGRNWYAGPGSTAFSGPKHTLTLRVYLTVWPPKDRVQNLRPAFMEQEDAWPSEE